MHQQRWVGGKALHYGYTTGSCAAAAAAGAAQMLLGSQRVEQVSLLTPKGWQLELQLEDCSWNSVSATCAVRKEAGDDPDVTDGILIYATVRRRAQDILIDGGQGIGRVTKSGLNQPVGAAAINQVPRQMITKAVQAVCDACGYHGGLDILIWAPQGEQIAVETYNPKLGIVGGISILGTSGIVEPMSQQALLATMETELSVLQAAGKQHLLLVLGNYGERFAAEQLKLSMTTCLKCSNYIGAALDLAGQYGFTQILLVGHIGKLSKLGAGIMNTHSAEADGRIEVLLRCALEAGASLELLQQLDGCVTTDGALQLLQNVGLLWQTMAVLRKRIVFYLQKKVPSTIQLEVICFTNRDDLPSILCQSDGAAELLSLWR